eukprot:TRINITY_DN5457_c0_g1_i1.p1 TRINITY_DN5457_c0_g1~~TRINITY_DN5457_c0_g1_i1.p1  ORF type:complete len:1082 (+),score=291.26 TRINITY_DN5457_c0_g1_i1:425-3247(+)
METELEIAVEQRQALQRDLAQVVQERNELAAQLVHANDDRRTLAHELAAAKKTRDDALLQLQLSRDQHLVHELQALKSSREDLQQKLQQATEQRHVLIEEVTLLKKSRDDMQARLEMANEQRLMQLSLVTLEQKVQGMQSHYEQVINSLQQQITLNAQAKAAEIQALQQASAAAAARQYEAAQQRATAPAAPQQPLPSQQLSHISETSATQSIATELSTTSSDHSVATVPSIATNQSATEQQSIASDRSVATDYSIRSSIHEGHLSSGEQSIAESIDSAVREDISSHLSQVDIVDEMIEQPDYGAKSVVSAPPQSVSLSSSVVDEVGAVTAVDDIGESIASSFETSHEDTYQTAVVAQPLESDSNSILDEIGDVDVVDSSLDSEPDFRVPPPIPAPVVAAPVDRSSSDSISEYGSSFASYEGSQVLAQVTTSPAVAAPATEPIVERSGISEYANSFASYSESNTSDVLAAASAISPPQPPPVEQSSHEYDSSFASYRDSQSGFEESNPIISRALGGETPPAAKPVERVVLPPKAEVKPTPSQQPHVSTFVSALKTIDDLDSSDEIADEIGDVSLSDGDEFAAPTPVVTQPAVITVEKPAVVVEKPVVASQPTVVEKPTILIPKAVELPVERERVLPLATLSDSSDSIVDEIGDISSEPIDETDLEIIVPATTTAEPTQPLVPRVDVASIERKRPTAKDLADIADAVLEDLLKDSVRSRLATTAETLSPATSPHASESRSPRHMGDNMPTVSPRSPHANEAMPTTVSPRSPSVTPREELKPPEDLVGLTPSAVSEFAREIAAVALDADVDGNVFLNPEAFMQAERERKPQASTARNMYHQLIFDAMNEALSELPSRRDIPFDTVVAKLQQRLVGWRTLGLVADQIDAAVSDEMHVREREWAVTEEIESDVKFALADLILDSLLTDTVRSLQVISDRRRART